MDQMQFILKIGPRHCPDGSFKPDKDGKNWIGVKFEVPKPKAILGAATRETIEPGDKAWIWTHHDKRRDGELRGRGLVGEAAIGTVKTDRTGSVTVQFSDVDIRHRNLLREVVEPHQEASQIVTNLFRNTTSRSIALSKEQAEEFAGVIAAIDPPQTAERWTDDELLACMLAYLDMLGKQQAGADIVKAEYRRALIAGPLNKRTDGSIEFRMQNLSAFFATKGMPIVDGYLPAKNVGRNVMAVLDRLHGEAGNLDASMFSPTDDFENLQAKSAKLSRFANIISPLGNRIPIRSQVTQNQFVRDPTVVAAVLSLADGKCEKCGAEAPFVRVDDTPFLEVHHVRFLAEGGPDTVDNAVGLCPNCHRACHYSKEWEAIRSGLVSSIQRLIDHENRMNKSEV
jgi:5-methylcytosine-specific restriction protein A